LLLTELLAPERVRVPLVSRSKDALLRELVELAAGDRGARVVEAVLQSVREREEVLTTGIGEGIAIPHGRTPLVDSLIMAAGVCAGPVEFDALDGRPVELCFLLIGPESAAGAHVKALSRISRLLRRDTLRDALRQVDTPHAFLEVVRSSEDAA
jgi:mannitol/fructose-specific phosphotransferase system IIA component (Ntr-type)